MSAKKPQIDFIGVGAPRSGTTWVAQCLSEHPDICLSRPKEVNFFNESYPFYRPEDSSNYTKGFLWYARSFSHCKNQSLRGEFSPLYLADTEAPKRIQQAYPGCKIIICLRNPIDKTLSHIALKQSQTMDITEKTYTDIVKKYPYFIKAALYAQQVSNYLSLFPSDQVHIMLFDDIQKNPQKTMQDLFVFLGASTDTTPSMNKVIHASKNKQGFLRGVILKIIKILKKIPGGNSIIQWLKYSNILFSVEKIIDKIDIGSRYSPLAKLTENERKMWYATYFAEDIEKLETIIKRDLSQWKK